MIIDSGKNNKFKNRKRSYHYCFPFNFRFSFGCIHKSFYGCTVFGIVHHHISLQPPLSAVTRRFFLFITSQLLDRGVFGALIQMGLVELWPCGSGGAARRFSPKCSTICRLTSTRSKHRLGTDRFARVVARASAVEGITLVSGVRWSALIITITNTTFFLLIASAFFFFAMVEAIVEVALVSRRVGEINRFVSIRGFDLELGR